MNIKLANPGFYFNGLTSWYSICGKQFNYKNIHIWQSNNTTSKNLFWNNQIMKELYYKILILVTLKIETNCITNSISKNKNDHENYSQFTDCILYRH